jgi:hypothetical protein
MVQKIGEEGGWIRVKTAAGVEGYVSFVMLSDRPVSNTEGIGPAEGRLPKEEEAKVLAAELRAIRTVCVVPPETADGGQSYSDAGELRPWGPSSVRKRGPRDLRHSGDALRRNGFRQHKRIE